MGWEKEEMEYVLCRVKVVRFLAPALSLSMIVPLRTMLEGVMPIADLLEKVDLVLSSE